MADEEKTYIDLVHVARNEQPKWVRLLEVVRERASVTEEENRLKEVKKQLNEELESLFDQFDLDGVVADDAIVERANGGTGGKWDGAKLFRILSPMELEEVYTEGRSYSYIKATRNEKRARKLVD